MALARDRASRVLGILALSALSAIADPAPPSAEHVLGCAVHAAVGLTPACCTCFAVPTSGADPDAARLPSLTDAQLARAASVLRQSLDQVVTLQVTRRAAAHAAAAEERAAAASAVAAAATAEVAPARAAAKVEAGTGATASAAEMAATDTACFAGPMPDQKLQHQLRTAFETGKTHMTGGDERAGATASTQRFKKARRIFRRALTALRAAGVGPCHVLVARAHVFLGFALRGLKLHGAATAHFERGNAAAAAARRREYRAAAEVAAAEAAEWGDEDDDEDLDPADRGAAAAVALGRAPKAAAPAPPPVCSGKAGEVRPRGTLQGCAAVLWQGVRRALLPAMAAGAGVAAGGAANRSPHPSVDVFHLPRFLHALNATALPGRAHDGSRSGMRYATALRKVTDEVIAAARARPAGRDWCFATGGAAAKKIDALHAEGRLVVGWSDLAEVAEGERSMHMRCSSSLPDSAKATFDAQMTALTAAAADEEQDEEEDDVSASGPTVSFSSGSGGGAAAPPPAAVITFASGSGERASGPPPPFSLSTSITVTAGFLPVVDGLVKQAESRLGLRGYVPYLTQLLRYAPGQEYSAHTDCDPFVAIEGGGTARAAAAMRAPMRAATLLVYLTGEEVEQQQEEEEEDVEVEDGGTGGSGKEVEGEDEAPPEEALEGGETVFPVLGNLTILPVAGTAVLWNNLDHEGFCAPHSLHAAVAPRRGIKYVLQKWYYDASALQRRQRRADFVLCDGSGSCREYIEANPVVSTSLTTRALRLETFSGLQQHAFERAVLELTCPPGGAAGCDDVVSGGMRDTPAGMSIELEWRWKVNASAAQHHATVEALHNLDGAKLFERFKAIAANPPADLIKMMEQQTWRQV